MKYTIFAFFLLMSSTLGAQSNLPSLSGLDSGWNTISTEGVCSAGTPYQFYAKSSVASDNLLIFFNGGGACWFGQACDLGEQPNIHSPFADMDSNNPALSGGIFDLENGENPFADYNMVFIPYCTGDVHIGAGERIYTYENEMGEEVKYTAHHNGYENSMTVLNWVYENFSSLRSVVITGSSAGAIGSSFYSGMVAEQYSNIPVILIADAAGGYGSPLMPITHRAWNTASILPDWIDYAGETNETISFEDFYIASANHSPNLTIAQYNAAEDETQKMFTQVIGDAPGSFSLPQRILTNYQEIESSVDDFYSYTAGGEFHTILRDKIFYRYEVEGVRFVDWVTSLVNGEQVRDISCVKEATGCNDAPE
ncbi:MAG: hypothetical protein COA96_04730 [SAR86 cluster bacterium]|uniref:Pectinacetylesterase n=1 Tax=SAR86 cluster bacterium TaxID=2030880 RepID=A0A2A5B681_9GAMM|nr:MAG: hypothetical protein COA96_04730 [SAR86 cluster bacterium]